LTMKGYPRIKPGTGSAPIVIRLRGRLRPPAARDEGSKKEWQRQENFEATARKATMPQQDGDGRLIIAPTKSE